MKDVGNTLLPFSNVKMVLDDDDEMTIKLLTALTIQQLNVQKSGSQFK